MSNSAYDQLDAKLNKIYGNIQTQINQQNPREQKTRLEYVPSDISSEYGQQIDDLASQYSSKSRQSNYSMKGEPTNQKTKYQQIPQYGTQQQQNQRGTYQFPPQHGQQYPQQYIHPQQYAQLIQQQQMEQARRREENGHYQEKPTSNYSYRGYQEQNGSDSPKSVQSYTFSDVSGASSILDDDLSFTGSHYSQTNKNEKLKRMHIKKQVPMHHGRRMVGNFLQQKGRTKGPSSVLSTHSIPLSENLDDIETTSDFDSVSQSGYGRDIATDSDIHSEDTLSYYSQSSAYSKDYQSYPQKIPYGYQNGQQHYQQQLYQHYQQQMQQQQLQQQLQHQQLQQQQLQQQQLQQQQLQRQQLQRQQLQQQQIQQQMRLQQRQQHEQMKAQQLLIQQRQQQMRMQQKQQQMQQQYGENSQPYFNSYLHNNYIQVHNLKNGPMPLPPNGAYGNHIPDEEDDDLSSIASSSVSRPSKRTTTKSSKKKKIKKKRPKSSTKSRTRSTKRSTTSVVSSTSTKTTKKKKKKKKKKKDLDGISLVSAGSDSAVSTYSNRSSRSIRSTRSSKSTSRKKRRPEMHPSWTRKTLPNKLILKYYKNGKIRFENSKLNGVVPFKHRDRWVMITPEQMSMLREERQKQRKELQIKRMQNAKAHANKISLISAKYLEKNKKIKSSDLVGQNVIEYASSRVEAFLAGWVVRWKLRRLLRATLVIQHWWHVLVPQRRRFNRYFANLKLSRQRAEMVRFVQDRFINYTHYCEAFRVRYSDLVTLMQNYVRMYLSASETFRLRRTVIYTQSLLRRAHVSDCIEMDILEQKLAYIKTNILRKYSELFAPFSRRATFCYKSRHQTKSSYFICLREYNYLMNLNDPFMDRKTFHQHLQFVLKMLKKNKTPNMEKIVRGVFEDDMKELIQNRNSVVKSIKRKFKLFRRKKSKKKKQPMLSNSLTLAGSSITHTPDLFHENDDDDQVDMDIILLKLVPEMFSTRYSISHANWCGLLILTFVVHDLIPEHADSQDIPIEYMLDPNGIEKIDYIIK